MDIENADFEERAVNLAKKYIHSNPTDLKIKRFAENVLRADEEYQRKRKVLIYSSTSDQSSFN